MSGTIGFSTNSSVGCSITNLINIGTYIWYNVQKQRV